MTADTSKTSKTCSMCWSDEDVSEANYEVWDARFGYSQTGIAKRRLIDSFLLDPSTYECDLNCIDGFWSNKGSGWKEAATPIEQICMSNNCKDFDAELGVDVCTICWIGEDYQDYANWPAKKSYAENLVGLLS